MSDQNEENKEEAAEVPVEGADDAVNAPEENTAESQASAEPVSEPGATPDFPELKPGEAGNGVASDLSRFKDVQVVVSAELGRTDMPIQELLGMSEGSVFTLNRTVTSPIELLAQGIPLGNGEVVVVDDVFAVRIKEIYSSN